MEKMTAQDLIGLISKEPLFTPFERSSLEITVDELEYYCNVVMPGFKTLNIDLKKITDYLARTDHKGWLFAGNTGSGKTSLSKILFRFMNNLQYRVNGVKIDDNRRYTWQTVDAIQIANNVQRNGYNAITELAKVINLHINDIGTEVKKGCDTAEVLYMGTRINPIESLLILRGEKKEIMTSATSNIPIDSKRFGDLYGDKVKSRLSEMCVYIEVLGVDYRTEKNISNDTCKPI